MVPVPTSTIISGNSSSGATLTPGTEESVLVIGGGLAGLSAAYELVQAGRKVTIIDQEPEQNLGGQAFWSLGGIFLVDSPEQRRLGIKDSLELARKDWFNSAQFDQLETEDKWAHQWAEEYLQFAAGPLRAYLAKVGAKMMFNVGWAERGGGDASGHGNSVPRFHITWGTGPEIVRVFAEPVVKASKGANPLVKFLFRHRVDQLVTDDTGRVVGVRGAVLEPSDVERGAQSSRIEVGAFETRGKAVLISSGGIGGNLDLIREMWPTETIGKCPKTFVIGVPNHVDGRMLSIAEKDAGANLVNRKRGWHYTEGLHNWNSIWPQHGIRVIPGPSSLWIDATGKRLPAPLFPGCDTIATLKYICNSGYDYTWFIANKTIVQKEFSLSGSEQNPDLTGKSLWLLLQRVLYGLDPVQKFVERGEDFVVESDLDALVRGMNALGAKDDRGPREGIDANHVRKTLEDRDDQILNGFSKDAQVMLINNARSYWPEKYSRVAKPHRILDPAHGPLIAIRMNVILRKTLGGIQTNLDSQVMKTNGETPVPGLYAAGEVAGFGGGGVMGYK